MTDIFGILNKFNLALQGRTVNIFNINDKVEALRAKLEIRDDRLNRQEMYSFTLVPDFVSTFKE
jgi:hypothetical protein